MCWYIVVHFSCLKTFCRYISNSWRPSVGCCIYFQITSRQLLFVLFLRIFSYMSTSTKLYNFLEDSAVNLNLNRLKACAEHWTNKFVSFKKEHKRFLMVLTFRLCHFSNKITRSSVFLVCLRKRLLKRFVKRKNWKRYRLKLHSLSWTMDLYLFKTFFCFDPNFLSSATAKKATTLHTTPLSPTRKRLQKYSWSFKILKNHYPR